MRVQDEPVKPGISGELWNQLGGSNHLLDPQSWHRQEPARERFDESKQIIVRGDQGRRAASVPGPWSHRVSTDDSQADLR